MSRITGPALRHRSKPAPSRRSLRCTANRAWLLAACQGAIDKMLWMWPARCSLGLPATGADTSVSAHRAPRSGTRWWKNVVGRNRPTVEAALTRWARVFCAARIRSGTGWESERRNRSAGPALRTPRGDVCCPDGATGFGRSPGNRIRRLDPAKPGQMSQVSGGEVELVDVGGDCLLELVEVGGLTQRSQDR
jgi:hypothetical protein